MILVTGSCGFEGCSGFAGLPIPFVYPDMIGGSNISIIVFLLDLILIYLLLRYFNNKWLLKKKVKSK